MKMELITAKKTKIIKNGDTMAFIKLEDRYGEIEVIVFSRQYSKFSSEIFEENAVLVNGSLSFEDGDEIRILLSDITPLKSNINYEMSQKSSENNEQKLYIKVEGLTDKRISTITRMALLNPGQTKIVLYDTTTKKYSLLKDTIIAPSEKVLSRLNSTFGDGNVILK